MKKFIITLIITGVFIISLVFFVKKSNAAVNTNKMLAEYPCKNIAQKRKCGFLIGHYYPNGAKVYLLVFNPAPNVIFLIKNKNISKFGFTNSSGKYTNKYVLFLSQVFFSRPQGKNSIWKWVYKKDMLKEGKHINIINECLNHQSNKCPQDIFKTHNRSVKYLFLQIKSFINKLAAK